MKIRLFLRLIICGLAACPAVACAQRRVIDSLEEALSQNGMTVYQRAVTMARLADAVSFGNSGLGLEKNTAALAYAEAHGDRAAASYVYSGRAALYAAIGDMSAAEKAADSAVLLARGASAFIKGLAFFRKGYLQNIDNNPDSALKDWQRALDLLGRASDEDAALYQANIYYLLYGIYAERSDSARATGYARLALGRAQDSHNPGMQVAALQINGTDYLGRFQVAGDSLYLDSAVAAFSRSVGVFRENSDRIRNQSVVALGALNLADIYMDYYPPWYGDSVLSYVNLALGASVEAGNKTMQANCYDIIGKLSVRAGRLGGAEQALLKERAVVDSIVPANYYLSMNLYESLARLKEQQGDDRAALTYYKQYLGYYRKEFDAEQFQTIQQLEVKYQDEKKDKALKLLAQRSAFQRKQTFLYAGIALAAVAGLLFLFLAGHFRLKYSLQREKLKDEEAARLLAEQRLVQREKQQLQKELLAGALHIDHKNEMLQNLKDRLLEGAAAPSARQLEKIINEEIRLDEDFERVKSEFKELHPEFFSRLQAKAVQKLTPLDLKYCAYLYMKMSSKQIAALLHVAPKSVRMAKYRLKQKLGLGKDDELDAVIQHMTA
jgi:DNA-binding CsgD family transcriptional regulator